MTSKGLLLQLAGHKDAYGEFAGVTLPCAGPDQSEGLLAIYTDTLSGELRQLVRVRTDRLTAGHVEEGMALEMYFPQTISWRNEARSPSQSFRLLPIDIQHNYICLSVAMLFNSGSQEERYQGITETRPPEEVDARDGVLGPFHIPRYQAGVTVMLLFKALTPEDAGLCFVVGLGTTSRGGIGYCLARTEDFSESGGDDYLYFRASQSQILVPEDREAQAFVTWSERTACINPIPRLSSIGQLAQIENVITDAGDLLTLTLFRVSCTKLADDSDELRLALQVTSNDQALSQLNKMDDTTYEASSDGDDTSDLMSGSIDDLSDIVPEWWKHPVTYPPRLHDTNRSDV